MIDNALEHTIDVYGDGSIIKTLVHVVKKNGM